MLHITFITIHPAMIEAYRQLAIFKRAEEKGLARIRVLALRDFAVDRHGTVDGRPCGGGEGMVLRADCLGAAVDSLGGEETLILPSARGRAWSDSGARELLATSKNLVFICGRFGGVDQRFIDRYQPQEISLGDFIVSGGELPALTMVDTLLRLVPGVLGHEESSQLDSFSPALGGCLEFPLYTKPRELWDLGVPRVLMSGDHREIAKWREQQSAQVTAKFRPDLLKE